MRFGLFLLGLVSVACSDDVADRCREGIPSCAAGSIYVERTCECVRVSPPEDAGPPRTMQPDAEATLSCQQAYTSIESAQEGDGELQALLACNTDADCGTWDPSLTCPSGSILGACPRGTHRDRVTATRQRFEELAAPVCARLAGCSASPKCSLTQTRCSAGKCDTVPPTDAGAP